VVRGKEKKGDFIERRHNTALGIVYLASTINITRNDHYKVLGFWETCQARMVRTRLMATRVMIMRVSKEPSSLWICACGVASCDRQPYVN